MSASCWHVACFRAGMRQHWFAAIVPAVVLVACGGAVEEPDTGKGRQSASAEKGEAKSEEKSDPPSGSTNGGSADESTGTAKPWTERCKPGEPSRQCFYSNGSPMDAWQRCEPYGGEYFWGQCINDTPLVLVFDGAPVSFASAPGATFDLAGDAASHVTSWPTARTPWLALDRDGNGRIDDGSELFGSMTRLSTGLRAKNGFEALAELDSNHDGAITAEDEAFAKLVVWADADANRVSSAAEQSPASERIVRLDLAYRNDPRCTSGGDCEVERARLEYREAGGATRVGEIVDVHLARR